MPPGANIIKGARYVSADPSQDLSDATQVFRKFIDSKLALAFYITAALAWYGTRIGLLRFGRQYVCARISLASLQFLTAH